MDVELEETLKNLKKFYLDKRVKQKTEISTIVAQAFLVFMITANLILAGYAASITYHGRQERKKIEKLYHDIYHHLKNSKLSN